MKNVSIIAIALFVLALCVLLVSCVGQMPAAPDEVGLVGSDRDKHGCIGSAGYSWCAETKQCERPWLIAERVGFVNTSKNFAEYCGK
jgi:hypothetical protein